MATNGLQVGDYACVLSTEINGNWETLGYAVFKLEPPPINIESNFSIGEHGRLLILLDEPKPKDDDPHGPKDAPTLTAQRTYLESLLKAKEWLYTIVTDDNAFTRELRSGGYTIYALFSEQVKLETDMQKELREAVYRGEGLIVAGAHDQRNHLSETLGIKYKGKYPKAEGLIFNDLTTPFAFADQVLHAESAGANPMGYFSCRSKCDQALAISYHEYGKGRSIYMGFDLNAQATANDSFASLLTMALLAVHPESLNPLIGTSYPINFNLSNKGIATPGQAIIQLPENTTLIDPGTAHVELDSTLIWPFDLQTDQEESFNFWLRLPWIPSVVNIEGLIQIGIEPNFQDYDSLNLEIDVQIRPCLDDAMDMLLALANEDKYYAKALNSVQKAETALQNGNETQALKELLKASDSLIKSDELDAPSIRLMLSYAIRNVAAVIFLTQ